MSNDKNEKPLPQPEDRVRARDPNTGHWRRGTYKGLGFNPGDPPLVKWDDAPAWFEPRLQDLAVIPKGEDNEDFE